MLKKINFILISLFVLTLLSTKLIAQEAKIPCLKKDGGVGLNGLEKFDCKLVQAVVNDPKIRANFQRKVNEALAKKLYTKASQRLEELARLDGYFEQIDLDLSLNSKEVASKCRLDFIANPKCGDGTNSQNYQDRLKILINKFPESTAKNADGSKNLTLVERMRARSGQIRGVGIEKVDNCPADGATGHFFLTSQFGEVEAEKFIIDLKNKINDRIPLERFYSKLPQFQMLNDVKKLSGAGASFLEKFENEMKKYDVKNGSPKNFIENFFFSPDTQLQLAKSLANKCEAIASNIRDYLCNDFDHLGMSDDLASTLFNDQDAEVDIETAKGFSCGMTNSVGKQEDGQSLMAGLAIGVLDAKFEEDFRKIPSKTEIKKIVDPFCEMYKCTEGRVKTLKSCRKGGPLASDDLEKYCKENKCDKEEMKYISFLKSLERDNDKTSSDLQSLASNPDGSPTERPKKGYSSFYQNFLGVEGTLLTEGKKITPITIAEKKAEFAEKKIDSGVVNPALSQSKEMAKLETRQEQVTSMPQGEKSGFETAAVSAREQNEQFRKSFQNQYMKAASTSVTPTITKAKKLNLSDTDSSRIDEMKKIRGELADAINKIKGSEEEKLAAISDNNRLALAPNGASKEIIKNMSSGDKDRLDSYKDSLNNWETRLRTWQGQLSDRDVRASSSSSSGKTSSESRVESPVADPDQYNPSSSANNGAKLSKTVAAPGSSGGKNDIASERAPGSERAEGEEGIVNSENLATLERDSLKNFGIVTAESFIIKVRHKEKIYSVPVKTFSHDGKSMFVPLLNEKDRELSKIVYESPLFKDYRAYQLERLYRLEKK